MCQKCVSDDITFNNVFPALDAESQTAKAKQVLVSRYSLVAVSISRVCAWENNARYKKYGPRAQRARLTRIGNDRRVSENGGVPVAKQISGVVHQSEEQTPRPNPLPRAVRFADV